MAGDWIKMELCLPDKPEVHHIAAALNLDPDAVIGKLLRVWTWFDQHTQDGNALGVTFALIDRLSSVTGFASAMHRVGWLEQSENALRMPNFDKHTSESAKKRALNAKRQSRFRNAESNATSNAPRVTKRREEKSNPPIPLSGGFELFWKVWPANPRKASRGKCFEVWRKKGLDPETPRIVAHVVAMKSTPGWRDGFVPAPLVYLNQERWDGAEVVPVATERKAVM